MNDTMILPPDFPIFAMSAVAITLLYFLIIYLKDKLEDKK